MDGEYYQKLKTKIKMKKMFSLFFGLIIIPLMGLGVFSFVNFIISMVFMTLFVFIQQSPLWIFWSCFILVFMVYYFTEIEKDL